MLTDLPYCHDNLKKNVAANPATAGVVSVAHLDWYMQQVLRGPAHMLTHCLPHEQAPPRTSQRMPTTRRDCWLGLSLCACMLMPTVVGCSDCSR